MNATVSHCLICGGNGIDPRFAPKYDNFLNCRVATRCQECEGTGHIFVEVGYLNKRREETRRLLILERENTQLRALSHALYRHPEDYDGPCECQTCMSYGVSDTP